MARVRFVKRANKDYPQAGIKKGDSYYRWRQGFRGPVRMSKEAPKASQTTGSAFLQAFYGLQEQAEGLTADDGLPDAVAEIVQGLRDLAEETEGSRDNMPEGLQQGDTGQKLEERAEACNNIADELENIDFDVPTEFGEGHEYEDEDAFWEAKLEKVNDVSFDAS